MSVEAVDPVFQTKMLEMLKQTGRPEMVVGGRRRTDTIPDGFRTVCRVLWRTNGGSRALAKGLTWRDSRRLSTKSHSAARARAEREKFREDQLSRDARRPSDTFRIGGLGVVEELFCKIIVGPDALATVTRLSRRLSIVRTSARARSRESLVKPTRETHSLGGISHTNFHRPDSLSLCPRARRST